MMTFESTITVGNNSSLGFDQIRVTTKCVGFVDLHIPAIGDKSATIIELKRSDLITFLLRTQPSIPFHLEVNATKENPLHL